MTNSAYGTPLIVDAGGKAEKLERVALTGSDANYSEKYLQELIFNHPSCLPIYEIDQSFSNLIPVCCELNTPAGPLDILFVTPTGRLGIVEAKLWRNPEARRKVIGQILDYAKELSAWSYEDLQREIARVTGRKGNALFEIAKEHETGLDEKTFCDAVSQSLSTGKFLLLIVGDGIREGAGAIADFIERSGNLQFTFGLVELALYQHPSLNILVQPRILAKSMIIKRTLVSVIDGKIQIEDDADPLGDATGVDELNDSQKLYHDIWSSLLKKLVLDDASQPIGKPTRTQNYFLPMPPSGGQAWVSAYFASSQHCVGVYLRFTRGNFADAAYQRLLEDQDTITSELGLPVEWQSIGGQHSVIIRREYENPLDERYRDEILDFFATTLNIFVNVFRPRLERIAEEL